MPSADCYLYIIKTEISDHFSERDSDIIAAVDYNLEVHDTHCFKKGSTPTMFINFKCRSGQCSNISVLGFLKLNRSTLNHELLNHPLHLCSFSFSVYRSSCEWWTALHSKSIQFHNIGCDTELPEDELPTISLTPPTSKLQSFEFFFFFPNNALSHIFIWAGLSRKFKSFGLKD